MTRSLKADAQRVKKIAACGGLGAIIATRGFVASCRGLQAYAQRVKQIAASYRGFDVRLGRRRQADPQRVKQISASSVVVGR
mmetsp:Transcript_106640/g.180029  ORF Transcript_106640/g.180029 Transcript_106640/m.180029 type:complete len:82 (+) Transcript_106640:778-1023(+)